MERALRCLSTAFLISCCMDVGSAGFQCAVFQHSDLSRVRRSTPTCCWRAFTSTTRKSVDRLEGTLRLRGGNSSHAPGGRVASDTRGQGHIDALQVEVLKEGIELEASCMQQERSVGDTVHALQDNDNSLEALVRSKQDEESSRDTENSAVGDGETEGMLYEGASGHSDSGDARGEREGGGGGVANGVTVRDRMLSCWECGETATIECAMCGRARYCEIECQKAHWPYHREACRSLRPRDRVEGPYPPRANFEAVAHAYAAGDKAAIALVNQLSPWDLEWTSTDVSALTPPPPELRGLTAEESRMLVNDKSDFRAVFHQRQRRAHFLAKLKAGGGIRHSGTRGGRGGGHREGAGGQI